MSDINECKLSGVMDHLRSIHTKSGNPMAAFTLKCKSGWFRVAAFGNVATHLLSWGKDNDPIKVSGQLSNARWQDEEQKWRDSFEIKAWAIELHEKKVTYAREEKDSGKGVNPSHSHRNGLNMSPAKGRYPLPAQRQYDVPTPPPGTYF